MDSASKQFFRQFASKRMAVVLVLGFVSGLPLALSFGTLTAWLFEAGVDRTSIGLFAAAGTPYAFKFCWSPLVDGVRLPFFTKYLGRRLGWIIFSQLLVVCAMLLVGFSDPSVSAGMTAIFAVMLAFASATQDIVIDAYRVELLEDDEQATGAAVVQYGYRMGMLASGGGALFIADIWGWREAYIAMAMLMGIGALAALWGGEPTKTEPFPPAGEGRMVERLMRWLRDRVAGPFKDFLATGGAWWVLIFVVVFKLSDAFIGVMTTPFLLDIGFTKSEIAEVVKIGGTIATLLGTFAGAWVATRMGLIPALLMAAIIQVASNIPYFWQAFAGHDVMVLWVVIVTDNFCGGMGSAIFVAFISRLCHARYTATQYALLSSLAAVGRTLVSSSAGLVSDIWGWHGLFAVGLLLGIPSIILVPKIGRYYRSRTE